MFMDMYCERVRGIPVPWWGTSLMRMWGGTVFLLFRQKKAFGNAA